VGPDGLLRRADPLDQAIVEGSVLQQGDLSGHGQGAHGTGRGPRRKLELELVSSSARPRPGRNGPGLLAHRLLRRWSGSLHRALLLDPAPRGALLGPARGELPRRAR